MKRKLLIALLALSIATGVYSQIVTADYVLAHPIETVDKYTRTQVEGSMYLVNFEFGGSVVQNPSVASKLDGAQISRIDFVYTKYKETSEFDQRKLNEERMHALMKLMPWIFEDNLIEWHIFRIEEAGNVEANQSFFHGFALYTKSVRVIKDGVWVCALKPMSRKEEVELIKSEVRKVIKYEVDTIRKVKKKPHLVSTGDYLPDSRKKLDKGIRFHNKSIWNRRKEWIREYTYRDIEVVCKKPIYEEDTSLVLSTFRPAWQGFNDTVISAVMNRNIMKWKDIIIVHDVTGSMSPYTTQTMAWRRLNQHVTHANRFVFFNDGDSRPDGPIGRSGGAYYVNSGNSNAIERKCYDTMLKGGGGAGPENNIEAILYALGKDTAIKEIVMIADNNAPIRDMALLSQVNIPIHIIVCGSWYGNVHSSYIQLAMASKGSVHTIEQDFENLAALAEGEVIKIGSQKYVMISGTLKLIR